MILIGYCGGKPILSSIWTDKSDDLDNEEVQKIASDLVSFGICDTVEVLHKESKKLYQEYKAGSYLEEKYNKPVRDVYILDHSFVIGGK